MYLLVTKDLKYFNEVLLNEVLKFDLLIKVFYSTGRSFSVPVGGYLISIFGARSVYRILAGFCLVTAILYSTHLYLRHLYSTRGSNKRSKRYRIIIFECGIY